MVNKPNMRLEEQFPTKTLSVFEKGYPAKLKTILRESTPEKLFYKGNISLLKKKAIGFCGSRKASEKGLATTKDCSEQIVIKGLVVISGNAAGVDFTAHKTSLENGGETIFVLPEGMNNFRIKSKLRPFWNWDKVLVISQFPNDAVWRGHRAMTRNALIVALSDAMIVVEAGLNSGTFNAAQKTMELSIPLYVAVYKNMEVYAQGNKALVTLGAKRLGLSKTEGRAKVSKVIEAAKDFNPLDRPQFSLI